MMSEIIQEDSFSSDEDFDEGNEGTDSESSTDVDEKLATEEVFDAQFLKCYSALRRKDAKIYDEQVKFFDENDESSQSSQEDVDLAAANKKSSKPKMTLLDHQLSIKDQHDILDEHAVNQEEPTMLKSHYERELDEIKNDINKITEDIENDDEFFVIKNISSKEKIETMLDKIDNDEDLDHLRQFWNDPSSSLSDEDKFLRDYILNKRYLPKKYSDNFEQTKNEDKSNDFFSKNLDDLPDLEDEKEIKKSGITEAGTSYHSDEKLFDKISRIPRNATSTIRDLVDKQHKKEKRSKKLEKMKQKKKALKDIDCEDVIGDLKTKFHYRETVPNDYGLTADELLMATDEELEKWVSLKKAISYKSQEQELYDKKEYDKKRQNLNLKKEIFKSIYGDSVAITSEETVESNDCMKRKLDTEDQEAEKDDVESKKPQKRRKKRCLNHKKAPKTGVAPDRLLAYGLSKNKLRKSKLL